jgi:asparagine synthase (glutamine-hydrolysing)
MRRALAGIVPDELLNRKRKAFIERGPRAQISRERGYLLEMTQHMVMDRHGIVNQSHFLDALRAARAGQEVALVTIIRTLVLEAWLRNLATWDVLAPMPSVDTPPESRPLSREAGEQSGLSRTDLELS